MVKRKIVYTNQAKKDAKKLSRSGLKQQAIKLFEEAVRVLSEDISLSFLPGLINMKKITGIDRLSAIRNQAH
jgi:hypothetical protein